EARALTALQEATAVKVGQSTAALRDYEEQLASLFRAQVVEAQARARAAERDVADAGVALAAATDLVRELCAPADGARAASAAPVDAAPIPVAPDADARATVEMREPPCEASDDEPEEELTAVVSRPVVGMAAAPNGLRLRSAAARAEA